MSRSVECILHFSAIAIVLLCPFKTLFSTSDIFAIYYDGMRCATKNFDFVRNCGVHVVEFGCGLLGDVEVKDVGVTDSWKPFRFSSWLILIR